MPQLRLKITVLAFSKIRTPAGNIHGVGFCQVVEIFFATFCDFESYLVVEVDWVIITHVGTYSVPCHMSTTLSLSLNLGREHFFIRENWNK